MIPEMPALQVQLFQGSGPVFTAVKPSGSVSVLGMHKAIEERSSDFFTAPPPLSLRLSIQWRFPLLGHSEVHQEDRDLGARLRLGHMPPRTEGDMYLCKLAFIQV